MDHFFSRIVKELEQGNDICLATIVNQIGSAPRSLGTSFLVRGDSSISGTIGGGRLEADVIRAAVEAISNKRAELYHFRLKGKDVLDSEMICGGNVDVYLEPVTAGDKEAKRIFSAASRVSARGGRALMVTRILPGPCPGLAGRRLLVVENGEPVGAVEELRGLDEALQSDLEEYALRGKPSIWMQTTEDNGRIDCFLEPIVSDPVVHIFGGGHVSLYLAQMAATVGFKIVIAEDREEYANPRRFPMAEQFWLGDFNDILRDRELGPDAYVVIVTRGHVFDKEVLSQALAKQTAYLGMIGSSRKRKMIYRALEEEGYTTEDLARVYSPIGLDIGAETPEEIAVSIVAELIQVRANRQKGNGV